MPTEEELRFDALRQLGYRVPGVDPLRPVAPVEPGVPVPTLQQAPDYLPSFTNESPREQAIRLLSQQTQPVINPSLDIAAMTRATESDRVPRFGQDGSMIRATDPDFVPRFGPDDLATYQEPEPYMEPAGASYLPEGATQILGAEPTPAMRKGRLQALGLRAEDVSEVDAPVLATLVPDERDATFVPEVELVKDLDFVQYIKPLRDNPAIAESFTRPRDWFSLAGKGMVDDIWDLDNRARALKVRAEQGTPYASAEEVADYLDRVREFYNARAAHLLGKPDIAIAESTYALYDPSTGLRVDPDASYWAARKAHGTGEYSAESRLAAAGGDPVQAGLVGVEQGNLGILHPLLGQMLWGEAGEYDEPTAHHVAVKNLINASLSKKGIKGLDFNELAKAGNLQPGQFFSFRKTLLILSVSAMAASDEQATDILTSKAMRELLAEPDLGGEIAHADSAAARSAMHETEWDWVAGKLQGLAEATTASGETIGQQWRLTADFDKPMFYFQNPRYFENDAMGLDNEMLMVRGQMAAKRGDAQLSNIYLSRAEAITPVNYDWSIAADVAPRAMGKTTLGLLNLIFVLPPTILTHHIRDIAGAATDGLFGAPDESHRAINKYVDDAEQTVRHVVGGVQHAGKYVVDPFRFAATKLDRALGTNMRYKIDYDTPVNDIFMRTDELNRKMLEYQYDPVMLGLDAFFGASAGLKAGTLAGKAAFGIMDKALQSAKMTAPGAAAYREILRAEARLGDLTRSARWKLHPDAADLQARAEALLGKTKPTAAQTKMQRKMAALDLELYRKQMAKTLQGMEGTPIHAAMEASYKKHLAALTDLEVTFRELNSAMWNISRMAKMGYGLGKTMRFMQDILFRPSAHYDDLQPIAQALYDSQKGKGMRQAALDLEPLYEAADWLVQQGVPRSAAPGLALQIQQGIGPVGKGVSFAVEKPAADLGAKVLKAIDMADPEAVYKVGSRTFRVADKVAEAKQLGVSLEEIVGGDVWQAIRETAPRIDLPETPDILHQAAQQKGREFMSKIKGDPLEATYKVGDKEYRLIDKINEANATGRTVEEVVGADFITATKKKGARLALPEGVDRTWQAMAAREGHDNVGVAMFRWASYQVERLRQTPAKMTAEAADEVSALATSMKAGHAVDPARLAKYPELAEQFGYATSVSGKIALPQVTGVSEEALRFGVALEMVLDGLGFGLAGEGIGTFGAMFDKLVDQAPFVKAIGDPAVRNSVALHVLQRMQPTFVKNPSIAKGTIVMDGVKGKLVELNIGDIIDNFAKPTLYPARKAYEVGLKAADVGLLPLGALRKYGLAYAHRNLDAVLMALGEAPGGAVERALTNLKYTKAAKRVNTKHFRETIDQAINEIGGVSKEVRKLMEEAYESGWNRAKTDAVLVALAAEKAGVRDMLRFRAHFPDFDFLGMSKAEVVADIANGGAKLKAKGYAGMKAYDTVYDTSHMTTVKNNFKVRTLEHFCDVVGGLRGMAKQTSTAITELMSGKALSEEVKAFLKQNLDNLPDEFSPSSRSAASMQLLREAEVVHLPDGIGNRAVLEAAVKQHGMVPVEQILKDYKGYMKEGMWDMRNVYVSRKTANTYKFFMKDWKKAKGLVGKFHDEALATFKNNVIVQRIGTTVRDDLINRSFLGVIAGLMPWSRVNRAAPRVIEGHNELRSFLSEIGVFEANVLKEVGLSGEAANAAFFRPLFKAGMAWWDTVGRPTRQRMLKGHAGAYYETAAGTAKWALNMWARRKNTIIGKVWGNTRAWTDTAPRASLAVKLVIEHGIESGLDLADIVRKMSIKWGFRPKLGRNPSAGALASAVDKIAAHRRTRHAKLLKGQGWKSAAAEAEAVAQQGRVLDDFYGAIFRTMDDGARRVIGDKVKAAFIDYGDKSALLRALTTNVFGMPFLTFSAKALPMAGKWMVKNPVKTLLMRGAYEAVADSLYHIAGGEGSFQEYERTQPFYHTLMPLFGDKQFEFSSLLPRGNAIAGLDLSALSVWNMGLSSVHPMFSPGANVVLPMTKLGDPSEPPRGMFPTRHDEVPMTGDTWIDAAFAKFFGRAGGQELAELGAGVATQAFQTLSSSVGQMFPEGSPYPGPGHVEFAGGGKYIRQAFTGVERPGRVQWSPEEGLRFALGTAIGAIGAKLVPSGPEVAKASRHGKEWHKQALHEKYRPLEEKPTGPYTYTRASLNRALDRMEASKDLIVNRAQKVEAEPGVKIGTGMIVPKSVRVKDDLSELKTLVSERSGSIAKAVDALAEYEYWSMDSKDWHMSPDREQRVLDAIAYDMPFRFNEMAQLIEKGADSSGRYVDAQGVKWTKQDMAMYIVKPMAGPLEFGLTAHPLANIDYQQAIEQLKTGRKQDREIIGELLRNKEVLPEAALGAVGSPKMGGKRKIITDKAGDKGPAPKALGEGPVLGAEPPRKTGPWRVRDDEAQ